MIVLDASGSMWGQIEGQPKIAIARKVLRDVLAGASGQVEWGLLAYGHRKKGWCEDIEVLIAPSTGAGAAIAKAVDALNPLGKTPLSASVRQAAETLKYSEDKATVILITDGLETCAADPCAVGRELEKAGVDFTAHVIGFGLSAQEGQQVACLAEETGGRYFPAANADGLNAVLSETVAELAEPPSVEEAAPEPATLPEASLVAPERVEIGRTFAVDWQGPGEFRDAVVLFDPEAREGEGRQFQYRRLVNGDMDKQQVTLVAPVHPGKYELRYTYRNERTVLATRAIEVIEAAVSLDAPATVEIGRRFTVGWVGPGATRDSVEIIDPQGNQGQGKGVGSMRIANGDVDKRTVHLMAPVKPGFYRLQYWNGDSREVLASREIEVLDAEVSLSAPERVSMGTRFEVQWVGPGASRDSVELFDAAAKAGEGKVLGYTRLTNGDMDKRSVKLTAPVRPGVYLLRYWNGNSREVLASREIEVLDAEVSLSAPERVSMGTRFEVQWVGPGASRDSVELFDAAAKAGGGKVLGYTRLTNGDMDKRSVKLTAPVRPGSYQLRYWNGDSRKVLVTRPITVESMEVAVQGPATVPAGQRFQATWVGPGATRDVVDVFNAATGKAVASARLINGDYQNRSVTIKAPAEPGRYQLRYYNGDSRTVLFEAPLTVQ
jgi:Ca-activated chloride channel family protein